VADIPKGFLRATELAHELVAERLVAGDAAVDATAGNGHDTLFLAGQVGPGGRVIAFDIQDVAISSTRGRLEEEGVLDRVTLIHDSHENCVRCLGEHGVGRLKAVMFNLGYLPGGDRSLVTRPEITVSALQSLLGIVVPGGVITLILYIGHPGGSKEAEAVLRFVQSLDPGRFEAVHYLKIIGSKPPPELLAITVR